MLLGVSNQMIKTILKLIEKTPFHPHRLEFNTADQLNSEILSYSKGIVLEVGCGNRAKEAAIRSNRNVTTYIGLDYPVWGRNYLSFVKKIKALGCDFEVMTGSMRYLADIHGDGNYLPIKSGSMDTICCFETLEHIQTPNRFFHEWSRVLRPGGLALISVPFLYQEHSDCDCYRYTRRTLSYLFEQNGFEIKRAFSHGGFGVALTQLINSFLIFNVIGFYSNRHPFVKYLRGIFCMPIFLFTNILGRIIDTIYWDEKYSIRYYVVAEKKQDIKEP